MSGEMKSICRKIAILGATSGIAEATARLLAEDGCQIALFGRNSERLKAIADDLTLRGAETVSLHTVDLMESDSKSAKLEKASQALGGLDGVLLFYGYLGDQTLANESEAEVRKIIDVNFTSAAEWLTVSAEKLRESDAAKPVILGVSSVAADRGRRSNYAYGAAKGGLSLFLQGMAHRMAAESNIRVVSMKLGFVKTPMTAHLDRSGPLWAEPDAIAKSIIKAMNKGGPLQYAPWFWRWIMLAIRTTPAFIFNKVNL